MTTNKRTIVLRKCKGAYSAGTPVTVEDRDARNKMNLCIPWCNPKDDINVHDNDLVALRPRTIYPEVHNATEAIN